MKESRLKLIVISLFLSVALISGCGEYSASKISYTGKITGRIIMMNPNYRFSDQKIVGTLIELEVGDMPKEHINIMTQSIYNGAVNDSVECKLGIKLGEIYEASECTPI